MQLIITIVKVGIGLLNQESKDFYDLWLFLYVWALVS